MRKKKKVSPSNCEQIFPQRYLRLGSPESAAETESGMQETHEGTTHVKGREGGLPEGQACPTLGIGRELMSSTAQDSCDPG